MTRDEILNMPAGREMDALVFAKLFGKMPFRVGPGEKWVFTNEREYLEEGDAYFLDEHQAPSRVPEYSTDIAAAWTIRDALGKPISVMESVLGDSFFCEFLLGYDEGDEAKTVEAFAETVSLAICRAALLVAMESE